MANTIAYNIYILSLAKTLKAILKSSLSSLSTKEGGVGGFSLKKSILGTINTVSIIAKVIDKEKTLDFPNSTSHISPSHLKPENHIPGIKIPANPVTVEKKLKNAVTAGL